MPVNPHKYGSIPRLGLLKIDGSASDQNGDNRPRSRISDTDSEYVKMAKIGGHASELILRYYYLQSCKFRPFSLSMKQIMVTSLLALYILLSGSRIGVTRQM